MSQSTQRAEKDVRRSSRKGEKIMSRIGSTKGRNVLPRRIGSTQGRKVLLLFTAGRTARTRVLLSSSSRLLSNDAPSRMCVLPRTQRRDGTRPSAAASDHIDGAVPSKDHTVPLQLIKINSQIQLPLKMLSS